MIGTLGVLGCVQQIVDGLQPQVDYVHFGLAAAERFGPLGPLGLVELVQMAERKCCGALHGLELLVVDYQREVLLVEEYDTAELRDKHGTDHNCNARTKFVHASMYHRTRQDNNSRLSA